MNLRRATVADAPAILPLATELYQLEDLAFDPPKALVALEKLLGDAQLGFAVIADPGRRGVAASTESERSSAGIAGYAICTFGYDLEFAGRDAYLTEILVAEAFRDRGIGKQLLTAVEDEARACDVHALHLLVRPENDPARALYEKRGYVANPRLVLTKVIS